MVKPKMSSLKEKADRFLLNAWIPSVRRGSIQPQDSELLDRLIQDAQQEIDFQKARVDVANEMVTSKQKRIDELKQKLQQLIDELKHRPSELGTLYSTYQEGWLDAMTLTIQKFEQLLKEVIKNV
jgi:peptidoglycan hydrolase CwlO-like protein